MVSKRNRIVELIEYLESLGIEVKVAKNKARGNKGFFKACGENFRIDISNILSEAEILSTLSHEFAHFVHYSYDKKLKSLDFIFSNYNEEILAELISATVDRIPKKTISPLFELKKELEEEIKSINEELKTKYFINNKVPLADLEKKIKKTKFKYFLKYDQVKYFEGFNFKIYTIEDVNLSEDLVLYIKLKSKMRALNRVRARITRLNRYYNLPTELWARAFEFYANDKKLLEDKAPKIFNAIEQCVEKRSVRYIPEYLEIYNRIKSL